MKHPQSPLIPLLIASIMPLTFAHAAAPITSHTAPYAKFGEVERLDPALDQLLPSGATMEKLAEGFNWSEGPTWMPLEGQLVFSDVPENVVYRWREGSGIDVFLAPSGFTGSSYNGRERGSNGLTVDPQGRLVLSQHGDRRIARLDPMFTYVPLADRFEGHRFNSPNDICFDRAGNFYFTDPPYGMQQGATPEMGFHGVYRVSTDGKVALVTRDLERPNGIALSPDERTLYVANSHGPRPIIMAFTLGADGMPTGPGRVFFDSTSLRSDNRRGAMDGMTVDARGNLWATGPGGVLILSPEGRHLGTLLTGRATGNCCFGDADFSTLYITADDVICRIKTRVSGVRIVR